MEKSNAIIKTDSAENWEKAKNYVPDKFTIIVYTYANDMPPRIKIGDGIHTVNELSFLISEKTVKNNTLIL